ncbi:hypothetical protein H671_2g7882 [Cricetulus griseus]|nr:hypothetical protein H671_2g7882 [Cricetulus griseus]
MTTAVPRPDQQELPRVSVVPRTFLVLPGFLPHLRPWWLLGEPDFPVAASHEGHDFSSGWCSLGSAQITVDKFPNIGQHPSGLPNWIIAWKLLHAASPHQSCLMQASV